MAEVADATGVELVDTSAEERSIVKPEAVLLSELREEPLTYRKYVGVLGKTDVLMRNTFSCDNMCSKFCWYKASEKSQAIPTCYAECNSEGCNYDQGGCLSSLKWSM